MLSQVPCPECHGTGYQRIYTQTGFYTTSNTNITCKRCKGAKFISEYAPYKTWDVFDPDKSVSTITTRHYNELREMEDRALNLLKSDISSEIREVVEYILGKKPV